MIKPYQMTDEELSNELLNWETYPILREAALRLVGLTEGSTFDRRKQRKDKLEDLLEQYDLNSIEILEKDLKNIDDPISLNDFLNSRYWQDWDESNRMSTSFHFSERGERCREAAEEGSDGSTHREVIDDWRMAVNSAPYEEFGPIAKVLLHREITECSEWHRKNDSLDLTLG